ncbi:unnamed protein product, partial [Meganyctiphanes norvegica]
VFAVAHTYWIAIVFGGHILIVLIMKLIFEVPLDSNGKPKKIRQRLDIYLLLSTMASTMVYFRLVKPNAHKDPDRIPRPTFEIQLWFLILIFVENVVLMVIGIHGLDESYDSSFINFVTVLCSVCFFFGVLFQCVYYRLVGHIWAESNGPKVNIEKGPRRLVLTYNNKGFVSKLTMKSCCSFELEEEEHYDNIYSTRKQPQEQDQRENDESSLESEPFLNS